MKEVAQIFKALSDETRLRIMALLVDGDELCVCDIMAALDMPQSTISRHLSYLRNAGLVSDRREGIWMYYQVQHKDAQSMFKLYDILTVMLADFDCIETETDKERLHEHMEQKKGQGCG